MRAIVVGAERGSRVGLADWPEPICGPDEVIVEMRAIGLCGSDLAVYRGTTGVPTYPWVTGHEGCGEVISIGENVFERQVGQHVVIEPNICCCRCSSCKSGRTSGCTHRRALGLTDPGIAAQRVNVPGEFTWVVPDELPWSAAACIEPYTVARAAARRAGVRPGDQCLVVGAGSQGLLMCLHLKSIGAEPFVVEPHDGRRKLALEHGAREPAAAPHNYSFVFETSGAPEAFRTALDATAPLGQLVLIGQSRKSVHVTTRELVQRQVLIRGSLIYDHPSDFAATVRLPVSQLAKLALIMRARYAPVDAAHALEAAPTIAGKSWIDAAGSWNGHRGGDIP